MRDTVILAREQKVMLHTHLLEHMGHVHFSLDQFNRTPGSYAEDIGSIGNYVWHAHCVKLNEGEIDLFQHMGTGVA